MGGLLCSPPSVNPHYSTWHYNSQSRVGLSLHFPIKQFVKFAMTLYLEKKSLLMNSPAGLSVAFINGAAGTCTCDTLTHRPDKTFVHLNARAAQKDPNVVWSLSSAG